MNLEEIIKNIFKMSFSEFLEDCEDCGLDTHEYRYNINCKDISVDDIYDFYVDILSKYCNEKGFENDEIFYYNFNFLDKIIKSKG